MGVGHLTWQDLPKKQTHKALIFSLYRVCRNSQSFPLLIFNVPRDFSSWPIVSASFRIILPCKGKETFLASRIRCWEKATADHSWFPCWNYSLWRLSFNSQSDWDQWYSPQKAKLSSISSCNPIFLTLKKECLLKTSFFFLFYIKVKNLLGKIIIVSKLPVFYIGSPLSKL